MYVEQFCSLFCTAVVPDSEVLVHQVVAKELNSSDVCRLIPYTTVCGHATAARKHVAEDNPGGDHCIGSDWTILQKLFPNE